MAISNTKFHLNILSKESTSWNILLIYTIVLKIVTAQKSPWDTPLDELKIVQQNISVCRSQSIDLNIEPLELEWQNCILPFLSNVAVDENSSETDEDQERQFYSHFCRDGEAYKKCWFGIIAKLNECSPGRGNTSALINFAVYDYSCRNNGTDIIESRIKVSETEDICDQSDHNYATQICKDSFQEWDSVDLCRRFVAQKKCDISSLSQCTNVKHQKFNEEKLNQIQESLGCSQTQNAHAHFNSSSSSNLLLFSNALFVCANFLLQFLLVAVIKD